MINCHVLESNRSLAAYKQQILQTTASTIDEICKQLPVSDIDIVYYVNPAAVIPEVAVCGYAPTANTALIAVDPENPAFAGSFAEEIPATLAHELHHCMRWRGPGYGSTILEALVTEGLARDFENNFRKGPLPKYHGQLSQEKIQEIWSLAKPELTAPQYSHADWLFGSKERGIPEFAGYVIGLHIVKTYLARTGASSAKLWDLPASEFLSVGVFDDVCY